MIIYIYIISNHNSLGVSENEAYSRNCNLKSQEYDDQSLPGRLQNDNMANSFAQMTYARIYSPR